MQNRSNLLHEIKKSINSNGKIDKLVIKIKNREIKEKRKYRGKVKIPTFNIIKDKLEI